VKNLRRPTRPSAAPMPMRRQEEERRQRTAMGSGESPSSARGGACRNCVGVAHDDQNCNGDGDGDGAGRQRILDGDGKGAGRPAPARAHRRPWRRIVEAMLKSRKAAC